MKKVLLILIGLLCFGVQDLLAQKLSQKYQGFLEPESKLIWGKYHQTLEKVNDLFILKTYNPDKQVLNTYATFLDKKLNKQEGPYKEFLDNGNLYKEGVYKANEKSGEWKSYNLENGNLSDYGTYINGSKEGAWFKVDELERVTEKFNYKNSKLDGEYLYYDTLGQVFQKKIFAQGMEKKNEVIDFKYYQANNNDIEIEPTFASCKGSNLIETRACFNYKYSKNVLGNIKYPEIAKEFGIEGTAIFRFVIGKDGTLQGVQTLRGLSKEIEEECLRVIELLPEWTCGLKNDEPVNSDLLMPIRFKLE